jgi:hypothetical protein
MVYFSESAWMSLFAPAQVRVIRLTKGNFWRGKIYSFLLFYGLNIHGGWNLIIAKQDGIELM